MTWLTWLVLAVIVTAIAAVTGVKPKGTRHVARTQLMGVARVVLILVALMLLYSRVSRSPAASRPFRQRVKSRHVYAQRGHLSGCRGADVRSGSERPGPRSRRAIEKLGTVAFATSCNAAAQPQFNRAVALLHSFEFPRAIDAFGATLTTDPVVRDG